jgi:hypothetical protein
MEEIKRLFFVSIFSTIINKRVAVSEQLDQGGSG